MEDFLKTELLRIAMHLYQTGPTQSKIWSRSGGDISLIFVNQVGRDSWYEALELLANGGGGQDITTYRLIEEMLIDFPKNQSLILLQNNFLANKKPETKHKKISHKDKLKYKTEEITCFILDELNEAFALAFTKSSLTQMLEYDFKISLENIALGDNLREIIFKVTKWAQSEGKLFELVDAAQRRNPGNRVLQQITREMQK